MLRGRISDLCGQKEIWEVLALEEQRNIRAEWRLGIRAGDDKRYIPREGALSLSEEKQKNMRAEGRLGICAGDVSATRPYWRGF